MASNIKDALKRKFRNEKSIIQGQLLSLFLFQQQHNLKNFILGFHIITEVIKYLLPYNVMLFLLYVNSFITMFINPGCVPDKFNKSISEAKKLAKKEKEKTKIIKIK